MTPSIRRLPHCWQTTIFPIRGPAGNLVALPHTRHASFAWHLSRWLQPSLCTSGTTGLLVVGSRSGVLPPGHATPSTFASPCSSFKCTAHCRLPLLLRRQGRRHRCMWQLQRLMPENGKMENALHWQALQREAVPATLAAPQRCWLLLSIGQCIPLRCLSHHFMHSSAQVPGGMHPSRSLLSAPQLASQATTAGKQPHPLACRWHARTAAAHPRPSTTPSCCCHFAISPPFAAALAHSVCMHCRLYERPPAWYMSCPYLDNPTSTNFFCCRLSHPHVLMLL